MKRLIFGLLIAAHAILGAQTIAEKKAGLSRVASTDLSPELQKLLVEVNTEHDAISKELKVLYAQAFELYRQNAPECAFRDILQKINTLKSAIITLEMHWQEMAQQGSPDGYALWQQPDTTLEQLVIDYGSQDYVYIFSPNIADIPISVTSNLPIPRSSWSEMLELILTQNGVGIKQLNPFLRELYLLNEDRSRLAIITNQRKDLSIFPSNERIAFVLSPEASDVRRIWFFLEKFINPNSVTLQMIGRDILIVGQVSEIEEILKLYDFATTNRGQKEYKAVSLSRVDAADMANILLAIFGGLNAESDFESIESSPKGKDKKGDSGKSKPSPPPRRSKDSAEGGGDNGLRVIPLSEVARAVFLVGTREEIHKAEKIIADVESQVGESRGKEIWWYTTKHADPEELADILQRIYYLLVSEYLGQEGRSDNDNNQNQSVNINIDEDDRPDILIPPPYATPFYLGPPINDLPPPIERVANVGRDNFIVDLKTGSIVMVVEVDLLPRIQELICTLDVPKKMVQLEVLLFEKKLNRQNNFGLNLLKIGTCASNTTKTCARFRDIGERETVVGTVTTGIFDFLLSRKENHVMPAFDLAYRFLLAQDDLHINSAPSVLAVNQTPAIIEIAEEISVNTGVFEIPTVGAEVTLKNSFARATYGIKIEILPTIHTSQEDPDPDAIDYVDMVTDITFQTFRSNIDNRPDITTRHILNEVSIPNGQTVIIGGLRQRNSHDISEKIPFFGELPGIGVLFSSTQLSDDTTEMFLFITPTIVYDPVEDLARIRAIEMCRRPGDIPPFLCRLVAAQDREKYRLFAASMALSCGRKPDRCVIYPDGEYDGR